MVDRIHKAELSIVGSKSRGGHLPLLGTERHVSLMNGVYLIPQRMCYKVSRVKDFHPDWALYQPDVADGKASTKVLVCSLSEPGSGSNNRLGRLE